MLTILPFDQEFNEKMFLVASLIAAYTNAHMDWYLKTLPLETRLNEIDNLKEIMQDMIEEKG